MKKSLIILVIWTLLLLGLLTAPFSATSLIILETPNYFDKIAHFVLFFGTGLVNFLGAVFISQFRNRMLFAIIVSLFLAISTELIQAIIPYRYNSIFDLLADIAGIAIALILCTLFYRMGLLKRFFKTQVKNN